MAFGAMWSLRGSGCWATLQAALQVWENIKRKLWFWQFLHFSLKNLNGCRLSKHSFQIIFAGEISLGGKLRPDNLGGEITKGNVYLDGHPICDDGWSREDATVACRWGPRICFHLHRISWKNIIIGRMLGYAEGFPERGSVYGPAETWDEFKLTDMSCKGDEENLEDCLYRWKFMEKTNAKSNVCQLWGLGPGRLLLWWILYLDSVQILDWGTTERIISFNGQSPK